jgi:hypothetical protein
MTIVSQIKELGFDYESGEDEFVTYKAHGSKQDETVFITLDVDTGGVQLTYVYADPEKSALDIRFSKWDEAIVRLLEWWSL